MKKVINRRAYICATKAIEAILDIAKKNPGSDESKKALDMLKKYAGDEKHE